MWDETPPPPLPALLQPRFGVSRPARAALAGGAFLAAGAATTGGNSAGTLELLKAEGQQTPGEGDF